MGYSIVFGIACGGLQALPHVTLWIIPPIFHVVNSFFYGVNMYASVTVMNGAEAYV